jgi:hypothetical protein
VFSAKKRTKTDQNHEVKVMFFQEHKEHYPTKPSHFPENSTTQALKTNIFYL